MACSKLITKRNDSGSLVLDCDVLFEMMTKLDKCKRRFAIISIVGQMRTGKSFLMNFLIRCLRNGGPKNPQWIHKKATEGFYWGGGEEPVTEGIHIWDEIFTMHLKSGEEISILLMDTQGLFDTQTDPGNDVKLFTFSTLTSSIQILNVFRQITERDLEHLQLCVEYADAGAKEGIKNFKLQNLCMLVRDWPYKDRCAYGIVGGNKHLKKILTKRVNNLELNKVREQLGRSFERLECFLMPSPGDKVNNMEEFNGKNSDLDKEFLKQVEIFTNHILDPDNLTLKTMNAMELGPFLVACDNAFVSGKVPEVTNMLEAYSKVFWLRIFEECVRNFRETIRADNRVVHPNSSDEFANACTLHSSAVLDQFDAHEQFYSSRYRQEYRGHLEEECTKFCIDLLRTSLEEAEKSSNSRLSKLFKLLGPGLVAFLITKNPLTALATVAPGGTLEIGKVITKKVWEKPHAKKD